MGAGIGILCIYPAMSVISHGFVPDNIGDIGADLTILFLIGCIPSAIGAFVFRSRFLGLGYITQGSIAVTSAFGVDCALLLFTMSVY